jgi:NADPH2:quinone reductase
MLSDIPQPVPKPNEVLTRVKACGLNRADLSAAKASFGHGVMGAPLGLEWAGEVAAVGSDVKDFKVGDRVVASGSGGYAEYAVSDYGRTITLPASFSFEQAAVLQECGDAIEHRVERVGDQLGRVEHVVRKFVCKLLVEFLNTDV